MSAQRPYPPVQNGKQDRPGLLTLTNFLRLVVVGLYNLAAFLQGGTNGVILTSNAERQSDGNYYRADVAQPGATCNFSAGGLSVSYVGAGANPIGFTGFYTLAEFPPVTDANGWVRVYQSNGKRRWTKRLTVNSGWPAATAWASMATTVNLPVGITNLAGVRHQKSFFATSWARVMTIESDATTASTVLVYHGTLGAGPGNWNAINPVVVIDVELTEI